MSFTVLMVCTGNICRSPLAERMLRARIGAGADVVVLSAGTHGLTGHEIDGNSAITLREFGIDADGHEAQRLDTRILERADLVLTATVEHRRILLEADPRLLQKVFTLREFARRAGELEPTGDYAIPSPDRLRTRVTAIAGRRGVSAPATSATSDIADPFGGSLKSARATAVAISQAIDSVIGGLELPRAPEPQAAPEMTTNSVFEVFEPAPGAGAKNRRVTFARHRA
jgi:protein-tyrosine phosphatase